MFMKSDPYTNERMIDEIKKMLAVDSVEYTKVAYYKNYVNSLEQAIRIEHEGVVLLIRETELVTDTNTLLDNELRSIVRLQIFLKNYRKGTKGFE